MDDRLLDQPGLDRRRHPGRSSDLRAVNSDPASNRGVNDVHRSRLGRGCSRHADLSLPLIKSQVL
jgi:hypothetical protein